MLSGKIEKSRLDMGRLDWRRRKDKKLRQEDIVMPMWRDTELGCENVREEVGYTDDSASKKWGGGQDSNKKKYAKEV